jgi:hypothetical protein
MDGSATILDENVQAFLYKQRCIEDYQSEA